MQIAAEPVRVSRVQELSAQFIRYSVVGGLAFLVDAGLLFALTAYARVFYLLSAALSFTAGLLINYLLSRYWVFNRRSLSNSTVEFTVFALIGIVGLLLTQALMWGFTEKAGLHYMVSKCCAAAIVLMWTFGARKWALFQ